MVELGLAIDLVTGPTSLAGAVYPQLSVDRGSLRVVVCMLKVFEPTNTVRLRPTIFSRLILY